VSFVNANGVSLHAIEMGEGPPVILLHGLLLGNLATWYFGAASRLRHSHHVLLYDLRGHGRSERVREGYDLDTMVHDLDALAASFSDQPLTLVGHSYGALIALKYALDHPARVARLVLVEAPLPPSQLTELEAFLSSSPEEMVSALPESFQASLEGGGRRAQRFVEGLRFLATETAVLDNLRSTVDIADDALATIQCPTLCLYGSQSSCREVGDRLSRAMPHARLIEIDGGHFLPIEAPAAVTRHIEEFLGG
jgi:pimeloyl-ACP methyl ester carboxylesterase